MNHNDKQQKFFGEEFNSEKRAEQLSVARQIAHEISRFEVSETQKFMIMYLIALELEDVTKMQELTTVIKELAGDILFIKDD